MEPLDALWILFAAVVLGMMYVYGGRRKPAPRSTSMVDETTRNRFPVPQVTAADLTPEARQAALELVAWAINSGSSISNIDLTDLVQDELQLGDWRITVERVDRDV